MHNHFTICYPHQLTGESTSGGGDQASGSSNKVPGRSTAHDASEHINLALSIERDADEWQLCTKSTTAKGGKYYCYK